MRRIALLAGLTAAICVSTARADDPVFTVDGLYLYGKASGYVQTPAGGEPGSTSSHRPKLSEIGINDVSLADGSASGWLDDNDELFIGGQIARLSGNSTLDSSLVSHGTTFPAGTKVSSDLTLDWYDVGYGHRFALDHDGDWSVTPSIAGALFNFDYRLRADSESASRSYLKPTFQLGVDLKWNPGEGPFSVDLVLVGTPPISGLAQMNEESLLLGYRLINQKKIAATAVLGVQMEQLDFEDHQTVSNHVHVDYGPMVVIGLELGF